LAIEAMHLGIMVCMGLVCFGLLMIGADFTCLRDEDYRSLYLRALKIRDEVVARWRGRGSVLAAPALAVSGESASIAKE